MGPKPLPILFLLILILSCSNHPASQRNVLDAQIKRRTLESNIRQIRKTIPDLDKRKEELLGSLTAINRGRDAYVSYALENEGELYGNSIVSERKFNRVRMRLFWFFRFRNISFEQAFREIDAANEIDERYSRDNRELFSQIDEYCTDMQRRIDGKEENRAKIDAEVLPRINKMADVEVVGIRRAADVFYLDIRMTNKTSKPIEELGAFLHISDGSGEKLITLMVGTYLKFEDSQTETWEYWRTSQSPYESKVYNVLQTADSSVLFEQEVTKIKLEGEEVLPDYGRFLPEDEHYSTPEFFIGYISYLIFNEELDRKFQKVNAARTEEIEAAAPIMCRFTSLSSGFVDNLKYYGLE